MQNLPDHTTGSGNIFADLGINNPEEMVLRADLATTIKKIIDRRNWTQKQAASFIGISQSDISDIKRGKIEKFKLERLLRYLRMLERDIEIVVKRAPTKRAMGKLTYKDDLPATTAV